MEEYGLFFPALFGILVTCQKLDFFCLESCVGNDINVVSTQKEEMEDAEHVLFVQRRING